LFGRVKIPQVTNRIILDARLIRIDIKQFLVNSLMPAVTDYVWKMFKITRKKIIKSGLIACLFIIISMNIVAYFHAYKMTHFGSDIKKTSKRPEDLSMIQKIKYLMFGVPLVKPYNHYTPSKYNLGYRTEYVKPNSGNKLEIWLIEHEINTKCILLFHGYKDSKHSLLNEANIFYNMGHDVILTDFRGCGGSDGTSTSVGFYESDDVFDVYTYVNNSNKYNEIILYGGSMGAVAILKAVADNKIYPHATIIESPYSSLLSTVKNRFELMGLPSFPFAYLLTYWGGVQNNFNALEFNTAKYCNSINSKVIILAGKNDKRATQKQIMEIYNNLNGPKKLYIFENANHESLLRNDEEKWRKIIEDELN
jgi:alpha-beta hydrolase superfamily lysophospholipase